MAVVRRRKEQLNTTISPLAHKQVKELTAAGVFSSESNAVETSLILMHFILNANTILPIAAQMGIKPLPVGGSV
jgi:hypothetical protein